VNEAKKVRKKEEDNESGEARKGERTKESCCYSLKRALWLRSYTHISGSIRDTGMLVYEHKMRHFALRVLNMATQMNLKESRVRL
jgi:hypothetical protein